MHILFLTDNFPPEVNAPATRTFEHCRYWADRGCAVTIITCAPNFPHGKVHKGYKNKLYGVEYVDNIRVIRVWSYITRNEGSIKRILDYLSFMVSAFIASFFVTKVDIIVGTSPQFFTICAARLCSLVRRRPWILELRDIWPESIVTVGAMKRGILIRALEFIERYLYRSAHHIVVVTNSFVELIVAKGANRNKISVITNGANLGDLERVSSTNLKFQLGLNNKFIVGYIGTHGLAHSLETIVDCAALIQERNIQPEIHFLFVGDGAQRQTIMTYAELKNVSNITFIGSVPKERVVEYLCLLDISVVHLRKDDLFNSVIPSKIFEAMALGIPIAIGVGGEALDIIESNGAGRGFEPEDPEGLAQLIQELVHERGALDLMAKSGRIAALKYNRESLAQDMLNVIRNIVGTRA